MTYEITVKNDGDQKIDDLEVTDIVPGQVTITQVSSGGRVEGNRVIWSNLGLADGEELTFFITVKVKADTKNGHTLINSVKARSEDKGLSASDEDRTIVEVAGKIAATKTEPTSPQPVPISAKTGGSPFSALFSILTGAGSLIHALRRFGV